MAKGMVKGNGKGKGVRVHSSLQDGNLKKQPPF